MQQKSIKKNYIYNLIYQLIVVVVPIITTPYISRVLNPDGVGAFSFTTAIAGYFALVGNLGIATYGQLRVAALRDDKSEMSKVFFELTALRAILSVIVTGLYSGFILLWGGEYKMLYWILVFQILASAFDIAWFLQGLEEFKKIVVRNALIKLLSVVFIFIFVKTAEDLLIYAIIMNASTLAGNLSVWLFLPKYVQRVKVKELKIIRHLKPCLIYFVPTIATTLYLSVDKAMIGFFTVGDAENGYYEQAHKIEQMAVTVVTSLSVVTMPRMAYLFSKNDIDGFKHNLNQTVRFILLMSVPMCLGLAAIAGFLVPLYLGDGYEKSIIILQVFSPLILIVGLNNAVGKQVLMAANMRKEYNISVIVGSVLNIGLNLALIPFYAALGAAIASVVAEFVILAMFLIFARKYIKVTDILKGSVKYLIAGLIMFASLMLLGTVLELNWGSVAILVGVGVVGYFLLLLLLRDKLLFDTFKKLKNKSKNKAAGGQVEKGKELTIEETQSAALDILKTVAGICEENNFRYCLIYGTLIGAVRHEGFIPWDDDVDIMMPRPDYEKFLEYMNENISGYPNLKVFNRDTCEDYPYMITRVSDSRYEIVMENEKPYGMGAFIDIYPYDGLGKDKKEAHKYGLKGDRLSSLCYQASRAHFAMETTKSALRKIFKFPVYLYAKMRGKDHYQKKLKRLAGKKDYEESNYIGCVVWLSGGDKDIFPKEWFDKTVKAKFGDGEFYIPAEYDKILTHIYGDYMQLPPEEERIGHHYYKTYKKEEN